MKGGFTARQLDDFSASFAFNQSIKRCNHVVEGMVFATGTAGSKAHRATEVATISQLDQPNAGVLFMFFTKAAIVGTAFAG